MKKNLLGAVALVGLAASNSMAAAADIIAEVDTAKADILLIVAAVGAAMLVVATSMGGWDVGKRMIRKVFH